jgi:hypothetical protein
VAFAVANQIATATGCGFGERTIACDNRSIKIYKPRICGYAMWVVAGTAGRTGTQVKAVLPKTSVGAGQDICTVVTLVAQGVSRSAFGSVVCRCVLCGEKR